MAFWRKIGRFGHTSYNYKREKVFWGKCFLMKAPHLVNTQQPALRLPWGSHCQLSYISSLRKILLSRRSCQVSFMQMATGILASSRNGCDRTNDNKSTNTQVSNIKNGFKGASGYAQRGREVNFSQETRSDKEMIRSRELHCQSESMEQKFMF